MTEAARLPEHRANHGIVFIALIAMTAMVPSFRAWPLFWTVPLICYCILLATIKPLRVSFRSWHVGQVAPATIAVTLAITLISCGVLFTFDHFYAPDVTHLRSVLPPSTALGGILLAGLIFSVLNALLEELAFRGILYDAAESQLGPWLAILFTATLFGYGHMHGYPPGPFGAILAGIYGLSLGWLRHVSGGLGLPFLSHIAADAVIFTIVTDPAQHAIH